MYGRLLITFVIVVFFGGVVLLVKRRQITVANRASRRLNEPTNTPTIVYFWSDGCPVCKRAQRPILEEILTEYGKEHLALTAYNIDEAPNVAREWGVMTLPTTIVLDATGTIKHINNGFIVSENLRRQLGPMIGQSRSSE